ncbi:polysaccharide deacetylase family protein [Sphingosinicella sp. BN140058]|uniref:polysaccharide deacetylase family protein n=1 Tax=Sphingosinicella sp. BN140058 TaxID=1892855 RepID=UPI00101328A8|nr:polysaccharide deacetylase family protein [Sphingosinicella sp. BN140058]QAY75229.1 polysaccharide deacetylase [Sphingosinicella sp. BN140058]
MNLIRLLLLSLLFALAAPAAAQKRIAFSFDDAPRAPGAFLSPDERTVKLIAGLKRGGVKQAAFFVNPGNLDHPYGKGGEDRLLAYVAAGHVLANHSFSHPHLNATSVEAYLADIDKASAWLKGREGVRPWFRFPFLDEGGSDKAKRDALRAGLKARGLRNGYVTTDGSDWNMEANAIAAVRAGKTIDMDALRDLYVETMVGGAEYNEALARKTLGRSPVHIFLMHETDLAALWIADVAAALREQGWQIVTADEAYADPIGAAMPDVPSAQGTLTEALAWQKGLPAPRWYERDTVAVANALFRERVLKEKP